MLRYIWRLAICGLLISGVAASAQNSPQLRREEYTVDEGGQSRTFVVAHDEIQVSRSGRDVVRKIASEANAENARRAAERYLQSAGASTDLILYEKGKERSEATRRFVTKEILVKLLPGSDPAGVARANSLQFAGEAPFAKGYFTFRTTKTGGALEAAEALRKLPQVLSAEPQFARQQQKRALPNDPYFAGQWHLLNTGQNGGSAGADVNVTAVWDTFRGDGVRIGIVDDGLEATHPDLASNIDSVDAHDWNDSTPNDPSPDPSIDFHGTACAGVAAARGNNSFGVSGAAPDATLVGLRLISAPTTDQQEAEAIGWKSNLIQIKSNSWGPYDDGKTLEGPGPLAQAALSEAAQHGRGGRGTIFVWAGGNGGAAGDNSNNDGYANSIYTIAVGALGNDGKRASYSEPGANLVVVAPSSNSSLGITTTDLTGEFGYNTSSVAGDLPDRSYTNDFGGTSSASPLVAGCVALILQANPALGWRDVQEILIRSASKAEPANADWITNAAGFHFNHFYGAGLIDTAAAVVLAKSWVPLPAQVERTSAQSAINIAIPDNNSAGVTRTFDLSASNLRVEHVTVKVNIQHASRGHLAVTLTSPSGTQSRLCEKHSDSGDNYANWTFSTVRNWGEDAQGVWTLKVADLTSSTTGTLKDAVLTVFGTPAPPVNQPPSITAADLSPSLNVFTDTSLSVSSISASDPEGEPISFAYQWQEAGDNAGFIPIAGANTSTLVPVSQNGKLVRCQVTPTAGGKPGAPFTTAAVAVNHRPPSVARVGQPFTYDSDLFISAQLSAFSRAVILNEFSQGNGGSKEWVELLTLKTADLRGYTLGDRGGKYVTFAQNAVWSAVPAGTLIVIYNGGEKDTILPADDSDPAGGSMVISHKSALFATGATWSGLSNSTAESIIVRDSTGQIVDSLSLNSENVYDPKLGTVAAQKGATFTGNTESGVDLLANWVVGAATAATPGSGNSSLNTQFVADLRSGVLAPVSKYRFAPIGDTIAGLTINADTGVISGTPASPTTGVFTITLEKYTASESVLQTFPLLLLGADGAARVPAGKSWTLNGDTVLPGSLLVEGTVDTAGHNLAVSGTMTLTAQGTVLNASGQIAYLALAGTGLPGRTTLISSPANDLADPDRDGLCNLLEFAFGLDASVTSAPPQLRLSLVNGIPVYTYSFPAGAEGVTRSLEVSNDLATWSSGPESVEITSDTTDATGYRTVTVRDITKAPAHFARLRVSR